jgi:sn-glycerol 3-phosphate transport system ATP-binding protein
MRAEIRRLQRRMGVTSLYVTHDQVEAMTLGDRLLVLHQGCAVQLATPMEVFERPANTYVAGFIGTPAMNFCRGLLEQCGAAVRLEAGPVLQFADGPRLGGDVLVGIRPEHVVPVANGIAATIELVEPLGSETIVIARLPNGELLSVKLPGGAPCSEVLHVAFPSAHLHVFDAATGLRIDARRPSTTGSP